MLKTVKWPYRLRVDVHAYIPFVRIERKVAATFQSAPTHSTTLSCGSTGRNLNAKLGLSIKLQLAESTAIWCRFRNFINAKTLRLLYYSFVHSRIQYGIILWETAAITPLRLPETRLNKIVRLMTWSRKYGHVSNLYKKIKSLEIK